MVGPGTEEGRDGSVVLLMFGMAVLGVAAFFGVVEPAGSEYARTKANEAKLQEAVRKEEETRIRLEIQKRGLTEDPRVVERIKRELGYGKKGEQRYVPAPESAPQTPAGPR